jgi:hypothetical protein
MIKENPWPSGESKPLILLSDGPAELARKHGLSFVKDADELDACHYCLVCDKDVGAILFHFYENYPAKGTAIYVDRNVDTVFAINRLIENYIPWVVANDSG